MEPVEAEIVLSLPLVHRCPFVDETDEGVITITYRPGDRLAELHGLAAVVDGYRGVEITSEQITFDLALWFREAFNPHTLAVTTAWQTAGIDMAVTVTSDDCDR